MNGSASSLVIWMLAFAALIAGQDARVPQSTFRAGVELIQLDVSVLDKDRHPVTGLTAADFTVLVDGKQRPVVAFKAVELPPPAPRTGAPWIHEIAPDVATNLYPSGRVIAILIDDYSFGSADIGPGGVRKARDVARSAVDALGADDRAAVLYTGNAHTAQSFTSDRRLLHAAIDNSAIFSESVTEFTTGAGPVSTPDQNGFCYCGVCSVEALGAVAGSLRSLPEQRKILLFVSAGSVVLVPRQPSLGPENECNRRKRDAMHDAIRLAQLANVTIQALDPKGLETHAVSGFRPPPTPAMNGTSLLQRTLENPNTQRIEFLRTVAEATGGRAVVNNNDMEPQVPAVLSESSSYYLLGVDPPAVTQDGRFHPIQVRLNQRGLEVRTRNGYYDPTTTERQTRSAATETRDVTLSIAGALPKPDFPMEVSVAPFATDDREAALAIAISVRQPADAERQGRPHVETIDVAASLFNPESGQGVRTKSEQLNVSWNATDASFGQYELLSRLPAARGRYELRVGAMAGDGKTASVYTFVEVPDFDADLSVSGLVLSATPAPTATAVDDLSDLLALAPTARRRFRATDEVTAFLQIYQGKSNVSPATVTTRLTNTNNEIVTSMVDPVEGALGRSRWTADYHTAVPVSTLSPGEYLLTIDVAAGGKTAQRALRFRVE